MLYIYIHIICFIYKYAYNTVFIQPILWGYRILPFIQEFWFEHSRVHHRDQPRTYNIENTIGIVPEILTTPVIVW
jgi:pyridoxine/pyridoxamine 5'-phosphate oxidase